MPERVQIGKINHFRLQKTETKDFPSIFCVPSDFWTFQQNWKSNENNRRLKLENGWKKVWLLPFSSLCLPTVGIPIYVLGCSHYWSNWYYLGLSDKLTRFWVGYTLGLLHSMIEWEQLWKKSTPKILSKSISRMPMGSLVGH